MEKKKRNNWKNQLKNKVKFTLPISVKEFDGTWIALYNDDTKLLFGENIFNGFASGSTKEIAIKRLILITKMKFDILEREVFSYQRWVPFRCGNWDRLGGRWIVIFGIHIYFRYGKGMKNGFYIPFTELNISIYSEWKLYRDYLKKRNNESEEDE